MASTFFTDGYRDGFDGKPCAPPTVAVENSDVLASEYRCGYRIGQQAAKELGTRVAELAREGREAAAAFNGKARDLERTKARLGAARLHLERIEHLLAL